MVGDKSSWIRWLLLGLVLLLTLPACGPEDHKGDTAVVNLAVVIDPSPPQSAASQVLAFIQRWLLGAAPAWAQAVSDIRTLQVQITGPDLPEPRTTSVPVPSPTSGQIIPVSIQAPVGSNRAIAVAALNAAGRKLFAGSLNGISLTPGTPINLEITLTPAATVTIVKQGAGTGTVTSSPPGIDCGSTCVAGFESGTSVVLNAAAAPGSTFSGWSGGGCSGTGSCVVNQTATITATFAVASNTATLTVVKSGNGSGTVTSSPGGINCGGDCSNTYAIGTVVTLSAAPAGGSTFAGWSGGGCSGTGTCSVTMNANQTVTATFTAVAPTTAVLVVNKLGSGTGTVTSSPGGINCGDDCSNTYAIGTVVTLSAAPAGGSTFAGWSGGGCSGTGTCSVTMNANQTVTATFNPPVSTATLTISKQGGGSGTVTSAPAGINCGNTCSASFPTGSSVTLTATAAGGSTFAGWSGGGCSGTGTCTTTMASSQTVVATFNVAPILRSLTINKTGGGSGTVTSSPGGITCGPVCTATFANGTVVTLTATPAPGNSFDGWNGGGGGDNNCDEAATCTLTMDRNRSISADFDD